MSARFLKTLLAAASVALVGIASLAAVTDGFRVLTSEDARRVAVARRPAIIPEAQGVDQTGRVHGLFLDPGRDRQQARAAIVAFIYTRCVDVCSVTGSSFEQLQQQVRDRHLESRVRLVSVSFDPAHDTPATLARYASQRRADPAMWTVEAPLDAGQLPGILRAFGVVVVQTPGNGFQHNAAFHVLDTQGRLAAIIDSASPGRALAEALSLSDSGGVAR